MSEMQPHRSEDDQEATQPGSSNGTQADLPEYEFGNTQDVGGGPHPGDPSLEEMLRRARDSGMDDTPKPGEPLMNMDVNS